LFDNPEIDNSFIFGILVTYDATKRYAHPKGNCGFETTGQVALFFAY
jgi:hypothetical protein